MDRPCVENMFSQDYGSWSTGRDVDCVSSYGHRLIIFNVKQLPLCSIIKTGRAIALIRSRFPFVKPALRKFRANLNPMVGN
jgi:hypothetical protein